MKWWTWGSEADYQNTTVKPTEIRPGVVIPRTNTIIFEVGEEEVKWPARQAVLNLIPKPDIDIVNFFEERWRIEERRGKTYLLEES